MTPVDAEAPVGRWRAAHFDGHVRRLPLQCVHELPVIVAVLPSRPSIRLGERDLPLSLFFLSTKTMIGIYYSMHNLHAERRPVRQIPLDGARLGQ